MVHRGVRRSQYGEANEAMFLVKVLSMKRRRMQSSVLSHLVKMNLFMPAMATQLSRSLKNASRFWKGPKQPLPLPQAWRQSMER